MVDNPLVSIITPVLNHIKYLEECIQSVLNQSYPHIEHVFVDGGSTDGTLEMLANYQTKYPDQIRFASEPDKGPEDAWNKGLGMAKGEIFGWLGADDVYEPGAIQVVVEFFRANPPACFVFGESNAIDEKGEIIQRSHFKDFDLDKAINDKCDIPAPSAFFKREVVEKVGLINTSTRISELDYWIRVGEVFQIHRIEKLLSNCRIYKGGWSGSVEAAIAYHRDSFIISRQHGGRIWSPRGRRYLMFVILDKLRLYPLVHKVLTRG